MVVYIDVFFALNFYMDLLILLLVREFYHSKHKIYRCIPAAILGSLYACVVLISDTWNGMIEKFFSYIVISFFMVIISFGYKNIVIFLKHVTMLFVSTFIMSGVINNFYFKGMIQNQKELVLVSFVLFLFIKFVIRRYKVVSDTDLQMTGVTIKICGEIIHVNALIDTGNSLIEPITKKPVAIIEKRLIEKILEGADINYFVIPYKSVGMSNGILKGIIPEEMIVVHKDKTILVQNVMLALYEGKFSGMNDYQMLLHPQMIYEGEKNVCKC